ncbi:hypothetical protein GCM10020254_16430 [Streptomyces goshikiensis]
MSEWLVLSIAMAAACAVVLSIAFFNHRRIGDNDDPNETPDVIEYMTMMIGVIYAIVLGLAIAGVWEGRGAAQEYVRQEAQALHEVSVRSEVYPVEVRKKIRADVDAYVTYVVRTEWAEMAESGTLTDHGGELLERIRRDVTDYDPQTDHEGQAYQPLVDQVAAVDDARSSRGAGAGGDDAGGGLVRADRGGAGDGRPDLHPADPALVPRDAAGGPVQCPDRVPAVPDLGLRRSVRPGLLGDRRALPQPVPAPRPRRLSRVPAARQTGGRASRPRFGLRPCPIRPLLIAGDRART